MSLSVQTDVFCDVVSKRCKHWTYGGPSSARVTAGVARRYAKDAGWIRKFNKELKRWEDICPGCQKDDV